MLEFPLVSPDFGSPVKTTAKLHKTEFGDGYSQRAPAGLNHLGGEYVWKAENLATAEKDMVVNFLKARGGAEAFLWTAPGESESWKWICEGWNRAQTSAGFWTVSATFKRVFDL